MRKRAPGIAAIAAIGIPTALGDVRPIDLRCEYRANPLGIDEERPRLSWILESAERAQVQTAYRILAARDPEALRADRGDLWDSGRVPSDRTAHIAYEGTPLRSGMRVHWKVRAWDRHGKASAWSEPAWWQMGLLDPADWKAQWIGAPGPLPPRVRAHNGFHTPLAASPDATAWVAVDLGGTRRIDGVRLHPARPFDWKPDTPGFLFPLRFRIDASDDAKFARFDTVVDRTAADVPNPGRRAVTYRFDPVPACHVRLVATRLRERDPGRYGLALAELEVLSGEENRARGAKVTASGSIESGAWSAANLADGVLVSRPGREPEPLPAAMLRKAFRLDGPARRATLYASALGLYEIRINGRRVGSRVLAPEWTDYRKRVQYQAYDVTPLLRPGGNAIGALLADGWYAGRIGIAHIVPGGPRRGIYGRRPRVLAQLEVECEDGRRRTIASDASWRVTTEGPIRSACILDGEVHDNRRAMPGWDRPGFDDAGWAEADAVPRVRARLVAQPNEPIRIVETIRPIRRTEPEPGVFIFDMGQNMVGWCRLRARGPAGTEVTLRHAEVLGPDGSIYTANLRVPAEGGLLGARQTDRFTLRGEGEEILEPRFTYHGFRYVEVRGLPARPALADLTGCVVHSAVRRVGRFTCSDPLVDRLVEAIAWTIRGNLHGIPTDCPQRDERLGWMGDAQIISQTACFLFDMAAFYTKWCRDIRDAQAADGRFPDFAPHPFDPDARFSGAPAWADAGVIIPWRMLRNYGDRRILARHFEAARRWVEYVRSQSPDGLWTGRRGNDYGDWLNGNTLILEGWPRRGAEVPREVLATAFAARSAELVAKMAAVLGRGGEADRYAALAASMRGAFRRAFVAPDGRIRGDTQAGYALALHFDLVRDERHRSAFTRHLVDAIRARDDHLSSGIQTSARLMLALARRGEIDLAYRLLRTRTPPSWGYMLDHGATTIWERWDGYVEGRGFQNPGMNSFNHYAFGAVGEWVVRTIIGIEPDEAHPGYARFTVRPRPGGGITSADGRYRSIRGTIAVAWRIEGDAFALDVTVPANTTATVFVPAREPAGVTESGRPAAEAEGVTFLRAEAGAAVYRIGSGRYRFLARR